MLISIEISIFFHSLFCFKALILSSEAKCKNSLSALLCLFAFALSFTAFLLCTTAFLLCNKTNFSKCFIFNSNFAISFLILEILPDNLKAALALNFASLSCLTAEL